MQPSCAARDEQRQVVVRPTDDDVLERPGTLSCTTCGFALFTVRETKEQY